MVSSAGVGSSRINGKVSQILVSVHFRFRLIVISGVALTLKPTASCRSIRTSMCPLLVQGFQIHFHVVDKASDVRSQTVSIPV